MDLKALFGFMVLEVSYWLSLALAVYPYVGYPAIAYIMAQLTPRRTIFKTTGQQPVSIVVAAYNEAQNIERRVIELSQLATAMHPESEIIVVSDGSTDATAKIVESLSAPNVRLIRQPINLGKAMALNTGVSTARHAFVIFGDARQSWDSHTLAELVRPFSDPAIGAVSGDLILETAGGGLEGVGFYWNLEKALRRSESRWHSSIGVTGAVCAVRRSLFPILPTGTVLDDLYWPMSIVMRGHHVLHAPGATARDRLPERIGDEYQRKVRTLAGNCQLVSLMPSLLVPWKNPVWFQFVSHKLLRLVTPWLLLILWLISLTLVAHPLYAMLFVLQTGFIAIAIIAWCLRPVGHIRPFGIAAAVFAMNCAALAAPWVWFRGRTTHTWKKVQYGEI